MEKSRKVLRRWLGKPESGTVTGPKIKDNSEPWLQGGVRSVADALLISGRIKETGRDKDVADIVFLDTKIQSDYLRRLPHASADEAIRMLERFLTPRVAEAALAHPVAEVRDLGKKFLRELAEEGDPFAAEILRKI